MKRWAALVIVIAASIAALVLVQRRKVESPVGPQAVLNAIAESERDATRVPARLTRMSDDDEIRAGDEIARYEQSSQNRKDPQAPAIEAYLQQVAGRMMPYANRKLPYKVHYLPQAYFVNAFALPGGHVFIGAGLMSLMDSEDELAAVLGHEMEHIDHYHSAERLQTEATLRKIPIAGALASIPVAIFQAGYTKDQEMEADRDGTYLAYRAEYSPTGALRMFEAFQRFEGSARKRKASSPASEVGEMAGELLAGYFRSHPFASERAEATRQLISEKNWPPRPERDLQLDCSNARKTIERPVQTGQPQKIETAYEPPCTMKVASRSAASKGSVT